MRAVEVMGLLLLASVAGWQGPARGVEPFVPVAVTYRPELVRDRERAQADFEAIRTLGFNTIRVPIDWATTEPARGKYAFDDLDRVLDAAARAELKVILELDTSPCRDSGAGFAEASAFAAAVSERTARHQSLYAFAFDSSPSTGHCSASTADRLTQLARVVRAKSDRFVATWTAEPAALRLAAGAASPNDDRAAAAVVDFYGAFVPPPDTRSGLPLPVALGLALDGVRSLAPDKAWMMVEPPSLQSPPGGSPLRVAVWTAVSRGARGVIFGDWRVAERGTGGFVDADGTLTPHARTAAGVARVIARNPALFAPLRPRRAKIAVAYGPGVTRAFANRYRSFFERNVPVDLVDAGGLAAAASRYPIVLADSAPTDVVAAAARVLPDVRIANATGPLETRFLESADVLMFIALNHADAPQRVTFTFSPDTQEAIWQNMETGTAVNFIAGPDGPRYTYSFAAKDALVLMIRRDIR